MPRDLRDPQKLGNMLLSLQRTPGEKNPVPMSVMYEQARILLETACPDYSADPSCIDKYGSPQDVKPRWQEIKVV